MYRSKTQPTSNISTSLWLVSTKTMSGVLGMRAKTSQVDPNHSGDTCLCLNITELAGMMFLTASDTMSVMRSWHPFVMYAMDSGWCYESGWFKPNGS